MCAVTCEEGEGDVAALFIYTDCMCGFAFMAVWESCTALAFRSRMAFNLELFIQLS